MSTTHLERLKNFVVRFAELLDSASEEPVILERGGRLLAELVSEDDWLPAEYAAPDLERYRQYLLHCDSRERFSVVSFVWGPGQATPVHDHRVWGLVGVLRGAELNQAFTRDQQEQLLEAGSPERLEPGSVSAVSPAIGDLHRVTNAYDDRASVSIHVYGANIGAVRRATYDAQGRPRPFVSGYANRELPNLWSASDA
jgi:predicted metal-dependent enzyme (double-stranded beta helix superfamily)